MMTPRIIAIAQLLFLQIMGISCWTTPFYGDDTLQKADVPVNSIRNSIGMEFVLVPAGEFMMGDKESVDELSKVLQKNAIYFRNSIASHRVIITKPFHLGKYEVTVGEFKRFVESTRFVTEAETFRVGWGVNKYGRSDQAPRFNWKNPGWEQTDAHPVGNVSWNDAAAFCRWLSKTEQKEYRLPTEAEWEYACRSGSETRYSFGDDPEGLAQFGNAADGTAKVVTRGVLDVDGAIKAQDGYVFTAPVGRFRPNALGLYDMHGNVDEWCSDWFKFKENNFQAARIEDPQGPAGPIGDLPAKITEKDWEDRSKVIRGGAWGSSASECRTAGRGAMPTIGPTICSCEIGFRVVVTTDPSLPQTDKTDP